jgi:hypothetical protein
MGYGFNYTPPPSLSFKLPSFKLPTGGFGSSGGFGGGWGGFSTPKYRGKSPEWTNIEKVAGRPFNSYAEAIAWANKQHHDGGNPVTNVLGNLLSDVSNTVTGIPMGLLNLAEHPIDSIKGIGQSYSDMYSPLIHGDFSKFGHNLAQHPLGPILDLATVLTMGAGGAAKAGQLLGKVGAISTDSRLARLGGQLTRETAAGGKSTVTKTPYMRTYRAPGAIAAGLSKKSAMEVGQGIQRPLSSNPFLRLRSNLIHSGIQKVPQLNKLMGEGHQYANLSRKSLTNTALDLQHAVIADQMKTYNNLDTAQRHAATHLHMYGEHLSVADAIKQHLPNNPDFYGGTKMHAAVEKHVKEAIAAHHAGKANDVLQMHNFNGLIGEHDAALLSDHGMLTQAAARNRVMAPLLHANAHLVHGVNQFTKKGATTKAWKSASDAVVSEAAANGHNLVGKELTTAIHRRLLDHSIEATKRRMVKADPTLKGFGDEFIHNAAVAKHIEALKNKVGVTNDTLNPVYVPHLSGVEKGVVGNYSGKAAGTVRDITLKHWNGILQEAAKIATDKNLGAMGHVKNIDRIMAKMTHEKLVAVSTDVPISQVGAMEHRGFIPLESAGGFMAKHEQAMNNVQHTGQVSPHAAPQDIFKAQAHPQVAIAKGAVPARQSDTIKMIHSSHYDQLTAPYYKTNGFIKNVINRPMQAWKMLNLGIVPRNFVVNTVGNTILSALGAHSPVGSLKILLHAASGLIPASKAFRATHHMDVLGATPEFMQKHLASQHVSSFIKGELNGGNLSKAQQRIAVSYRATHAHEIHSRQAVALDVIKHDDFVRNELKRMGLTGRPTRAQWEEAAARAFKKNPHLQDHVAESIDKRMGNYRDFTKREQQIRNFLTFYAWFRHIGKSTAQIVAERPTVASGLAAAGQYGDQKTTEAYGKVPDYVKAFLPIGGGKGKSGNKIVQALNLQSINPFNTIGEFSKAAKSSVSGDPSKFGQSITGLLSPFITAGIEARTGNSLLTGAPIKEPNVPVLSGTGLFGNFAAHVINGLPETRLLNSAINPEKTPALDKHGRILNPTSLSDLTPTGQAKAPKGSTISKDFQTQLENILGLPVKNFNLKSMQDQQTKIDQTGQYHQPKPTKSTHKPKAPSYSFGAPQKTTKSPRIGHGFGSPVHSSSRIKRIKIKTKF